MWCDANKHSHLDCSGVNGFPSNLSDMWWLLAPYVDSYCHYGDVPLQPMRLISYLCSKMSPKIIHFCGSWRWHTLCSVTFDLSTHRKLKCYVTWFWHSEWMWMWSWATISGSLVSDGFLSNNTVEMWESSLSWFLISAINTFATLIFANMLCWVCCGDF